MADWQTKAIKEELDWIAKLEARAAVAKRLGLTNIERGCKEDIRKRELGLKKYRHP
jgi:hypothetical protein